MPQTEPAAPPAPAPTKPSPAPAPSREPPPAPAPIKPQRELDPFNPDWPKTRPTPVPKAQGERHDRSALA